MVCIGHVLNLCVLGMHWVCIGYVVGVYQMCVLDMYWVCIRCVLVLYLQQRHIWYTYTTPSSMVKRKHTTHMSTKTGQSSSQRPRRYTAESCHEAREDNSLAAILAQPQILSEYGPIRLLTTGGKSTLAHLIQRRMTLRPEQTWNTTCTPTCSSTDNRVQGHYNVMHSTDHDSLHNIGTDCFIFSIYIHK